MANGIRTGDPRGFNKGRSSKFHEGSRVRQTPEEGRKTYQPKRCGNNNKDEDNSPETHNDKNILLVLWFSVFFCFESWDARRQTFAVMKESGMNQRFEKRFVSFIMKTSNKLYPWSVSCGFQSLSNRTKCHKIRIENYIFVHFPSHPTNSYQQHSGLQWSSKSYICSFNIKK